MAFCACGWHPLGGAAQGCKSRFDGTGRSNARRLLVYSGTTDHTRFGRCAGVSRRWFLMAVSDGADYWHSGNWIRATSISDKVDRCGKPLLISRLPTAAYGGQEIENSSLTTGLRKATRAFTRSQWALTAVAYFGLLCVLHLLMRVGACFWYYLFFWMHARLFQTACTTGTIVLPLQYTRRDSGGRLSRKVWH